MAWLEELLNEGAFACVMVSHDRYFLENVATEIVELNKVYADGLLRVKGSYSKFIEGKQAYMEAQSKLQGMRWKNRVKIEVANGCGRAGPRRGRRRRRRGSITLRI